MPDDDCFAQLTPEFVQNLSAAEFATIKAAQKELRAGYRALEVSTAMTAKFIAQMQASGYHRRPARSSLRSAAPS
jgi:hypothetical protein